MDLGILRERMVAEQLIPRGIQDERVLEAMRRIPRHLFVPEFSRARAYADAPVSIGEGQTISQPYMAAVMTEALRLEGNEKVLEIGTGSGYQTALLCELCASVYTLERLGPLAARAEEILGSLGYRSVSFRVADGSLGWEEAAPFDRVIVTAAASRVPLPLGAQLAEGGILVAPVGDTFSQVLKVFRKRQGRLSLERDVCACVFVPLLGRFGWEENSGGF